MSEVAAGVKRGAKAGLTGPATAKPAAGESAAESAANPAATPEVWCIGESMTQLIPADSHPVRVARDFHLAVAGAESNVAIGLAQLGRRSAWHSRVGADPFGQRVLDAIGAAGVDIRHVAIDATRPTGFFVKDPGSGVHYYRAGSAASALGPDDARAATSAAPAVIHISGVTAALSESCLALCETLLAETDRARTLISFDVNHRQALWPDAASARSTLRSLAEAADIVLVGLDEAHALWATDTPDDVRDLLSAPSYLVVKDGARETVEFGPDGRVAVAALRISVTEVVGAGDAYAAGWLHAFLAGAPARTRLGLGHRMAARSLATLTDTAEGKVPENLLEQWMNA